LSEELNESVIPPRSNRRADEKGEMDVELVKI